MNRLSLPLCLSMLAVVPAFGCATTPPPRAAIAPTAAETRHRPEGEPAYAAARARLLQTLRARRAQQVARLRQYAEARVFPRNDFQPGTVSMLLGPDGHPCAMAYLVIESGESELIATLARSNNGLQFADVRSGRLYDWILASGLTQEEAAFVQEPDFYIDERSPGAANMESLEAERLRAHFLTAAQQIEMTTDRSLEVALQRLGSRSAS